MGHYSCNYIRQLFGRAPARTIVGIVILKDVLILLHQGLAWGVWPDPHDFLRPWTHEWVMLMSDIPLIWTLAYWLIRCRCMG